MLKTFTNSLLYWLQGKVGKGDGVVETDTSDTSDTSDTADTSDTLTSGEGGSCGSGGIVEEDGRGCQPLHLQPQAYGYLNILRINSRIILLKLGLRIKWCNKIVQTLDALT